MAILLVVVFHIWFGSVSGGVDAFLFISGFFLIPSLIRAQSGAVPVNNPLPRLWRILVRLWLPMALVVAVTVAATWYVYPSTRRAETLGGALWSDLFVENWALGLAEHAYADATSLPSPFQHLWSIAVQAQVFLVLVVGITVLGLLLRVVVRRSTVLPVPAVAPLLTGTVLVATLASFGYATFIGPADQALNYYSTVSRFWEIGLGGLVGLAVARVSVPGWLRVAAGFTGLAMLGMTGFVVDGAATFPGPAALLPLGGTMLVFLAGAGGTSPVSRGLASRPLVWLGTVAYHLYLWHWPLLVLFLVYRSVHGDPVSRVSLLDGLAIIAISLFLASGSHWLLKPDSPVRRLHIRAPLIVAGSAAALVVAVQALTAPLPVLDTDEINWAEHPGAAASRGADTPPGIAFIPDASVSRLDIPPNAEIGCLNDGLTDSEVVTCDFGAPRAPGRKVLMLMGGSHADHFLPALDAIGKRHEFTVETVIMAGCPLAGPQSGSATPGEYCRAWQKNAVEHALTERPDAIFTNSTRPAEPRGTGDQTPPWYVDAFTTFSDAGIPVVGVRDLPWLMGADGMPREPFDCLAVRDDPIACGAQREDSLLPEDPAVAALGHLPGVHLVDFNDLHCGPVDCPAVVGNVLVYRDSHHYTRTFMLTMTPFIAHDLGLALGWWDDADEGQS